MKYHVLATMVVANYFWLALSDKTLEKAKAPISINSRARIRAQ
jgi:hypothetical protein